MPTGRVGLRPSARHAYPRVLLIHISAAIARSTRKKTASGSPSPRPRIWATPRSAEISRHSVSSRCSPARSLIVGSPQPTTRPSSPKPCMPANFSSSMTRGLALFQSFVKPGRPGHAATDHLAFERVNAQPHFGPTIRITHRSSTGLTVPNRSR